MTTIVSFLDRVRAKAATASSGQHMPIWDEKRLRAATDAAGVALWSWNVDTDAITMDERAYDLWEISKDEKQVTFETLSKNIHPADLERVRSAFAATSFKSARWAASGWWLRSSKRVIEERRAVPTLLARADEVRVKRREFIAGLGGTAVGGAAAGARPIGWTTNNWISEQSNRRDSESVEADFLRGLSEAGYVAGHNVQIESTGFNWRNAIDRRCW